MTGYCFSLAQKCHKRETQIDLSDGAISTFWKVRFSIGNGEVDSSILSGSTSIFNDLATPLFHH
jgi:hypothetical protein